jgi:hypothetical protein
VTSLHFRVLPSVSEPLTAWRRPGRKLTHIGRDRFSEYPNEMRIEPFER